MHLPSPQGRALGSVRVYQKLVLLCVGESVWLWLRSAGLQARSRRRRRRRSATKFTTSGRAVYIVHTSLPPSPHSHFEADDCVATSPALYKMSSVSEAGRIKWTAKKFLFQLWSLLLLQLFLLCLFLSYSFLFIFLFYFFFFCLLYFAFNNIFTLMLGHFGQRAGPHFVCLCAALRKLTI